MQWALGLFVLPYLIWLLASNNVCKLAAASYDGLSSEVRNQALFLLCFQQGLPILILIFFLRLGDNAYRLARDGGQFWYMDELRYVPEAMRELMAIVPAVLIATALLVLTGKLWPAVLLIGVDALGVFSAMSFHLPHTQEPYPYWGLKVLIGIALGAWFVFAICYNLIEAKRYDWIATYYFFLGCLIASPILGHLRQGNQSWLLYAANVFLSGVGFLMRDHAQAGDWLAMFVDRASTAESGSLLQYFALAVPLLWPVAWTVAMVLGLHWLLGAPWRNNSAPAMELESTSTAT